MSALFAYLAITAAPAAEPSAAPTVSDVVLARSALAALDADAQLHDVNLLVSVVDRVAVVGGPVASTEQGKRAASIIRHVPGIVEVKNCCFVQESPDPLLRAMADRMPKPRRLQSNELPGMVASPRTGVVERFEPASEANNLASVEPFEKSVVARRPANPGASILLPPVGQPGARPPIAPAAAPALPAAVLTSRPGDALSAAESVRLSDRRFADLSVALSNGTLVISGSAARPSDAWDLAQQLRKVPGVPRVALGAIQAK